MLTYVPPRGPESARIMIVGEAPGKDEVRALKPFVGYSGMEMSRMLREAGILEHECFITNVLRFQPPFNDENHYITAKKGLGKKNKWRQYNGRFLSDTALTFLKELWCEIEIVRPNIIIAMGDLALWALTGESGIMKWRGSLLPLHPDIACEGKVIPTLHPAFILHMGRLNWPCRPVIIQDLRVAEEQSHFPELKEPGFNFIVRPSFELAEGYLKDQIEDLDDARKHISIDIETRAGQIACIGFATSSLDATCIPLLCTERQEGYWSASEELEIVKLIRTLMLHPNALISGQNFMYDIQYIAKQWGFAAPIWWDTMVMQHVMFPDLPQILKPKSLGFLQVMYCEHPRYWKDEGKTWQVGMDENIHWNYNCKDAVATWEIAEAQKDLIRKMDLGYPADFQMRLWFPLVKMMLRGIRQDLTQRAILQIEVDEYMVALQARIDKIVGHPLNPRSAKQLKELFYHDLGIKPVMSRTKPPRPTLNDDALTTIAKREPILKPLIQCIQHYRSAGTFSSMFLGAETDIDGRMRCMTSASRAKTFRLATSKDAFGSGMNLQNQPRNNVARDILENGGSISAGEINVDVRDAINEGYLRISGERIYCDYALPNVRKLFIPDDGYTIFDADLERADLQVVVWEADDAELKQMLQEGVDIHTENAKVVGLTRHDAKEFIHAVDYKITPQAAARAFGKTVHEMEVAMHKWFSAHPGILEWQKRTARQLPLIQNKFGYKIHFLDLPERTLTNALAWTPQSTVAIVINHGLVAIDETLPEVQILLQVHDSLLFQIKTDLVPAILPKALELMRITIPYDDPLIIPVSVKSSTVSWGDCK